MTQKADGMNYAPQGQVERGLRPGRVSLRGRGLDHGHIYGMCNGLIEAGGELVWVYDPDPQRIAAFCATYPGVKTARAEAEVLEDPSVQSDRQRRRAVRARSARVAGHGSRQGLLHRQAAVDDARATRRRPEKSRRDAAGSTPSTTPNDCTSRPPSMPDELIRDGAIGRVVQVIGLGPHRLNAPTRPAWFWDPAAVRRHPRGHRQPSDRAVSALCRRAGRARPAQQGGQLPQPGPPGFRGFRRRHFPGRQRRHLLLPRGLVHARRPRRLGRRPHGDLGTDGYIELRKYLDVARDATGDHVYLVDHQGEHHLPVHGKVGFPVFRASSSWIASTAPKRPCHSGTRSWPSNWPSRRRPRR